MENFVNVGYYNCLDAVMMKDCSADKVVEYMEKGIGDFRTYDSDSQIEKSVDLLLGNHCGKMTEDGEYIVAYDVSGKFDHIPLDLVAENAQDEFIEVWKKMN